MSSPICRVAVKLSFPLVAEYRDVDMRQLLLWLAGKQVLAVLPDRSNERVPSQAKTVRLPKEVVPALVSSATGTEQPYEAALTPISASRAFSS